MSFLQQTPILDKILNLYFFQIFSNFLNFENLKIFEKKLKFEFFFKVLKDLKI